MKRGSRFMSSAVMFLLVVLSSANTVLAADYSVELGVDSRAGKDAGTLECVFDEICTTRLEPLGLRISVYVSSKERGSASISLYGDELACCYFNGAASSALVDLRDTLSRLPIFLRDRAWRDLFIENERPVGTLYLRFQRR